MWGFLKTVVKEIGKFLRSRVFLFIVISLFLYFGIMKTDQLKEIVEAIKELMK